jgi:hypothetical protein
MVYQFVLRPDGWMGFTFVSEGSREVYGREPDQITQDYRSAFDQVHPEDVVAFMSSVRQSAASRPHINGKADSYAMVRRAGSRRHLDPIVKRMEAFSGTASSSISRTAGRPMRRWHIASDKKKPFASNGRCWPSYRRR